MSRFASAELRSAERLFSPRLIGSTGEGFGHEKLGEAATRRPGKGGLQRWGSVMECLSAGWSGEFGIGDTDVWISSLTIYMLMYIDS